MNGHGRLLAALVLAAAVAGLAVWQYRREAQVRACHSAGAVWDGAASICRPALPAPILKRDGLQRI
jgi:hypothetical protein